MASTAEPSTPRRDIVAPATPTTPSNGLLPDKPPIAALFLIEFDVKAGYTIVWKQATPGLDLSGAVEYKSLPSGLHAVSEDLIYFVHDDAASSSEGGDAGSSSSNNSVPSSDSTGYAGLSAFVNLPTDEAGARNARMIAVGVLVPRSYGRLGRAWRHAAALMDMARKLAADSTQVPLLEAYWHNNSSTSVTSPTSEIDRPLLQITDSPLGSPAVPVPPPMGYRSQPTLATPLTTSNSMKRTRNRSTSDGTTLLLPPSHRLSPHHPAWSLTTLLDTFGPLIFPIYRAALLRKRILISTHAPVREVNNFVYNISVLANIPISALDLLEPSAVSHQRIRPLFTIGVNDITFLMDDLASSKRAAREAAEAKGGDIDPSSKPPYIGLGWIACTTDSILAMKNELWDVLITMPPPAGAHQASPAYQTSQSSSSQAPGSSSKDKSKKAWPTVEIAKGVPLKATQRDLRRYKALVAGLERLAGRAPSASEAEKKDAQLADAAESVVEPVTWAALAYHGFMWWASAGEQSRSEETDETIHDAQLLVDIVPPRPQAVSADSHASSANLLDSVSSFTARRAPADGDNTSDDDNDDEGEERARLELAIITYFHRLTTQILSVLSDIVESGDDDDDEYEEDAYYDDDDDEGDDGNGYFYDEDNDGEASAANGANDADGVVGRAGRSSSDEDGLVGARRSGLSRSGSSSTALLLRRRNRTSSQRSRNATSARNNSRRCAPHPHTLRVNSDAVSRMGLDVWSQADAAFVTDIAQQYFCAGGSQNSRRRAVVHVESKGIEVCGLKVC